MNLGHSGYGEESSKGGIPLHYRPPPVLQTRPTHGNFTKKPDREAVNASPQSLPLVESLSRVNRSQHPPISTAAYLDPTSVVLKTHLSTEDMKELNANIMFAMHKARQQLYALRKQFSSPTEENNSSTSLSKTLPMSNKSAQDTHKETSLFHFESQGDMASRLANDLSATSLPNSQHSENEISQSLQEDFWSAHANKQNEASAIWLLKRAMSDPGGAQLFVANHGSDSSVGYGEAAWSTALREVSSDAAATSSLPARNMLVTFASSNDKDEHHHLPPIPNSTSAVFPDNKNADALVHQQESLPIFFPIGNPNAEVSPRMARMTHKREPNTLAESKAQRCLEWRHRLAVLEVCALLRITSEGRCGSMTLAGGHRSMLSPASGIHQCRHNYQMGPRITQLPFITTAEAARTPADADSIRSLFCLSLQRIAASNAATKARNKALSREVAMLAKRRSALLLGGTFRSGSDNTSTIDWVTMGPLPQVVGDDESEAIIVSSSSAASPSLPLSKINNSTIMLPPQPTTPQTPAEQAHRARLAVNATSIIDSLLSRPSVAAVSAPPTARKDSLSNHIVRLHRELVLSRGGVASNTLEENPRATSDGSSTSRWAEVASSSRYPIPQTVAQLSQYLAESSRAIKQGTVERRWLYHYMHSLKGWQQGASLIQAALEAFGEEAS